MSSGAQQNTNRCPFGHLVAEISGKSLKLSEAQFLQVELQ